MKIIFLMYYGDIGGAELVNFQHAMIAKNNGLDVTVLTPTQGATFNKIKENGINIIYCPEIVVEQHSPGINQQALAYLEKHIKDADVVYNGNFFNVTKYIPVLKKKYNFRYLTIVHSNIDWVFQQLRPYDTVTDGYFATHILIKEELLRHGFSENKITLIPNTIDTSEVLPANETIRKQLKKEIGIPEGDIVLGMTARINFDKNIKDTVRLMEVLNKKVPASFVLLGEATYPEAFKYKEEFIALINKSSCKDKFHLLGKMETAQDVYHWQRVFDIGVNISPSEGTPMALFEQMAAGIYCMYPSIGGIPEVLSGCGSVIPIRQRMVWTEINKYPCYTDDEIDLYVQEIFKHSKAYFSEKGAEAREYIKNNRDIKIFEKDVVNFFTGGNMKVTVLLTTYNSKPEFLEKSVGSIINQTYADFEFVIVDDGSTNKETIAALKEYERRDKRIKLFFMPENSGIGPANNYGLKNCTGDLIIKIDHDDIAYPDLVEKQVLYFKTHPDAVVCGVQIKCFEASSMITNHPEVITKEYVLNMKGNWIMNHPGVAYKKDVILGIGGYIEKIGISEDYSLWCRLLAAGYVLNNHKDVLMHYRTFNGNFTSTHQATDVYQNSLKEYKSLLSAKRYPDKVTYHMATFPDRIDVLKESIQAILPQCDELHIYLNGFKTVPGFLNYSKIITYLSDEHFGNIGDAGKFFNCDEWSGYNFTVDDKIIYPPDYTEKTIKKIEQYERKALVTYHGRILFSDRPSRSYYKDYIFASDYLSSVPQDKPIHIPGTGVMAFHSEFIKFDMDLFKFSNMSDIFIGLFAQTKNIVVMALQHTRGWLKNSRFYNKSHSISSTFANNDEIQTNLINNHNWKKL